MTALEPATSADETPAFINAGDDVVFAMLTRPTAPSNGIGVVLVPAGGLGGSALQNRLWVRLARDLAARGFHVVRHDFRGVGDSSGTVTRFLVDEPFVTETESAAGWLAREGIDRVMLVGTCYGARSALAAAARMSGVEALALVSCPVTDNEKGENFGTQLATQQSLGSNIAKAARLRVLRKMLDAERRRHYIRFARVGIRAALRRVGRRLGLRTLPPDDIVSPIFVREFETVLANDVKVFFVFGRDEADYKSFQVAADRLPMLGDDPSRQTTVMVFDDETYVFNTIKGQQAAVSGVRDWLTTVATEKASQRV
jgi:pimeloyl-ACP methyl ester carboxylesterase